MELVCTTILLINMSADKLNKSDLHVINRSIKVCKDQYNSCVRSIVKKESNIYNTECGIEYKK